MALVAYDNSDSSDFDEDDDSSQTAAALPKVEVPEATISQPVTESQPTSDQSQSLFNLLPRPSSKKPVVIEEDDEILHKKAVVPNIAKPKARITVPSLSDFKDLEDTVPNKPKTIVPKGSGLLSLLPQPKNHVVSTTTSKSLIPHMIALKPTASTVKKKTPLPSPLKPKPATKSLLDCSDDSGNEDEVQNDFFSIHKPVEIPSIDLPLDIDAKVSTANEKFKNTNTSIQRETQSYQSYYKENGAEQEVDLQPDLGTAHFAGESSHMENGDNGSGFIAVGASNELALDDEAIRQLCGARGKRRREEIQLVDVDQREVLGDSREWLLKGLMDDTTKRVSSKRNKGNEPTSQQKRKHQITYLAHQAKANEAELQNQWANNRQSKRQTQSKYGF